MRRFFDFAFSLLGLVVLSPLFAAIMVVIKFSDAGPVFHKARRIGLNGRLFLLFKFRTMIINADKIGSGITTAGDERITPVGRFLRRYKLDEFPQLLNVVRGEMSLVGPRPEDPRYVALYNQSQRRILAVLPGMTSPASLTFKDEASALAGPDWEHLYINEIVPKKIAVDLDYFEHNTLWSDFGVIIRTIMGIVR